MSASFSRRAFLAAACLAAAEAAAEPMGVRPSPFESDLLSSIPLVIESGSRRDVDRIRLDIGGTPDLHASGMAFGPDGTLYVMGNVNADNTATAIVYKGKPDASGKRVVLFYEEHRGLPTDCFGATPFFVDSVVVSDQ